MSTTEKEAIMALVAQSSLPRRHALAQLRLSKSTYYRWLRRQREDRLRDRRGGSRLPWNRLRPEEEAVLLAHGNASPELSCRQLALRITDSEGIHISESTVYRVLKREGLIKPSEVVGFPADKEYRYKTRRPNELWATDCSYLKVVGWGWYYLVTVLDDFSRFILVWKLQVDMTANSLIDVVQEAIDVTGMTDVPVENRTALLSDNGPGYLCRKFEEYLRLVNIRHIIASPYHPQTNGKLERYHRTVKEDINLLVYEAPSALEEAISSFVEYYNYRRYHEALKNVTPFDVYMGRQQEILDRRREVKRRTLEARRRHNDIARGQGVGL